MSSFLVLKILSQTWLCMLIISPGTNGSKAGGGSRVEDSELQANLGYVAGPVFTEREGEAEGGSEEGKFMIYWFYSI